MAMAVAARVRLRADMGSFGPQLCVKSRIRLLKLDRGHGCDERSDHGDDGDSTPKYRLVTFRSTSVLVVTRAFLLGKVFFFSWESS